MKLREEARPGVQERKSRHLAAGIALMGMIAASPVALGQPKEQCSAQVQSGSITAYHSKDKKSHLVSTPLMRPGKYLSLKIPESHMDKVVKAAKSRPEGERPAFVRDNLHGLIETALVKVGKGDRASFDCGEAKAAPQVSPPADSKAKAQPEKQESAAPKAKAPEKPKAPADTRRRTITPGQ